MCPLEVPICGEVCPYKPGPMILPEEPGSRVGDTARACGGHSTHLTSAARTSSSVQTWAAHAPLAIFLGNGSPYWTACLVQTAKVVKPDHFGPVLGNYTGISQCVSSADSPTPAHQPEDKAKESVYSGELAILFRIKKDPGSPICPPQGSTCAHSITTWSRQEYWMPNRQGKCIRTLFHAPSRVVISVCRITTPPCPPVSLPEANVPLLKPHVPLMRLE